MRISSVAVRPRMSLARAVSCTPGSWTTTRSAPCCWMIGSATPSSLTRLRRIVMFCWTAPSWMRFCASGFRPATSRDSPPAASCSRTARSGNALAISFRASSRSASSRKRSTTFGLRATTPEYSDLLLAHQRADVGRVAVGGLVERAFHVDLQQEVHAAAQVEAEVHRQRADRRQPVRRDDSRLSATMYVVAELRLQHVLGLELRVGVGEAHLDAGGVERRRRGSGMPAPSAHPRRLQAARCRS